MAIVQEKEGGGMCHFTRRGLGLLLYLNSVKAKSPNSLQLLALTHISILASGPARETDIVPLAGQQDEWLAARTIRKKRVKVVSLYKPKPLLEVLEYK